MSPLKLLLLNFSRRKRRTLLMLACIATVFFIYGVLFYLYYAIQYANGPSAERRVTTTSSAGFIEFMPRSHAQRIGQVEGVRRITYASFFNSYFRTPDDDTTVYAVDPATWMDTYSAPGADWDITPEDRRRFLATPDGILVGEQLSRAFGWKLGDRITLSTPRTILRQKNGSRDWQFTVAGFFHPRNSNVMTYWAVFHHDYFDSLRAVDSGKIAFTVATVDTPADMDSVARRIDGVFAGSDTPTQTVRANDFFRNLYEQSGNVELIVRGGATVALIAFMIVVGNTLATAIFERRKELAILQTIGFSKGWVRRLIFAEAIGLGVAGGVVGLTLAMTWLHVARVPRAGVMVQAEPLLFALLVMVGFGIAIAAVPAMLATRLELSKALTAE